MAAYLVTGGCGFIGSHLADALLAAGHAVSVLDDLSTGRMANKPAGATLLHGDVADQELGRTCDAWNGRVLSSRRDCICGAKQSRLDRQPSDEPDRQHYGV